MDSLLSTALSPTTTEADRAAATASLRALRPTPADLASVLGSSQAGLPTQLWAHAALEEALRTRSLWSFPEADWRGLLAVLRAGALSPSSHGLLHRKCASSLGLLVASAPLAQLHPLLQSLLQDVVHGLAGGAPHALITTYEILERLTEQKTSLLTRSRRRALRLSLTPVVPPIVAGVLAVLQDPRSPSLPSAFVLLEATISWAPTTVAASLPLLDALLSHGLNPGALVTSEDALRLLADLLSTRHLPIAQLSPFLVRTVEGALAALAAVAAVRPDDPRRRALIPFLGAVAAHALPRLHAVSGLPLTALLEGLFTFTLASDPECVELCLDAVWSPLAEAVGEGGGGATLTPASLAVYDAAFTALAGVLLTTITAGGEVSHPPPPHPYSWAEFESPFTEAARLARGSVLGDPGEDDGECADDALGGGGARFLGACTLLAARLAVRPPAARALITGAGTALATAASSLGSGAPQPLRSCVALLRLVAELSSPLLHGGGDTPVCLQLLGLAVRVAGHGVASVGRGDLGALPLLAPAITCARALYPSLAGGGAEGAALREEVSSLALAGLRLPDVHVQCACAELLASSSECDADSRAALLLALTRPGGAFAPGSALAAPWNWATANPAVEPCETLLAVAVVRCCARDKGLFDEEGVARAALLRAAVGPLVLDLGGAAAAVASGVYLSSETTTIAGCVLPRATRLLTALGGEPSTVTSALFALFGGSGLHGWVLAVLAGLKHEPARAHAVWLPLLTTSLRFWTALVATCRSRIDESQLADSLFGSRGIFGPVKRLLEASILDEHGSLALVGAACRLLRGWSHLPAGQKGAGATPTTTTAAATSGTSLPALRRTRLASLATCVQTLTPSISRGGSGDSVAEVLALQRDILVSNWRILLAQKAVLGGVGGSPRMMSKLADAHAETVLLWATSGPLSLLLDKTTSPALVSFVLTHYAILDRQTSLFVSAPFTASGGFASLTLALLGTALSVEGRASSREDAARLLHALHEANSGAFRAGLDAWVEGVGVAGVLAEEIASAMVVLGRAVPGAPPLDLGAFRDAVLDLGTLVGLARSARKGV